jgi:hypothetical protein
MTPPMELYRDSQKEKFYIGPEFVFPKVHAVNAAALGPLVASARPSSPID